MRFSHLMLVATLTASASSIALAAAPPRYGPFGL